MCRCCDQRRRQAGLACRQVTATTRRCTRTSKRGIARHRMDLLTPADWYWWHRRDARSSCSKEWRRPRPNSRRGEGTLSKGQQHTMCHGQALCRWHTLTRRPGAKSLEARVAAWRGRGHPRRNITSRLGASRTDVLGSRIARGSRRTDSSKSYEPESFAF